MVDGSTQVMGSARRGKPRGADDRDMAAGMLRAATGGDTVARVGLSVPATALSFLAKVLVEPVGQGGKVLADIEPEVAFPLLDDEVAGDVALP